MAEAKIVDTKTTRISEFTEWMLPLSPRSTVPLPLGASVLVSPGAEALLQQSFRVPDEMRDMLLVLYSLKQQGASAVAAFLPLGAGPSSVWVKTPASRAFTTIETDAEHRLGSVWLDASELQAVLRELDPALVRRPNTPGAPTP